MTKPLSYLFHQIYIRFLPSIPCLHLKMASRGSPHHVGDPSLKFDRIKDGKMTILPKDLNIVWGKDDRYWKVPGDGQAAELQQVSWLEVTGSVDQTDPNKKYDVGFQVSLTPDAFGWGTYPIYIMAKRGKAGKFAWRKYTLNPNATSIFDMTGSLKLDQTEAQSEKIYFGMYEVWSGKWKGGLKIHHAFIRECP